MIDLIDFFYNDLKDKKAMYYNTFEEFYDYCTGELNESEAQIKINIYDVDEAIRRFKNLVHVRGEYTMIDSFEFILICYFLHRNGYYIKEFPSFLERPSNLADFSNIEIKNLAEAKYGRNGGNNGVAWRDRDSVSRDLEFMKTSTNAVNLKYELNSIFKLVSTRNADFAKMTLDEKLEQIRNVFEYIGKKDDKYIQFPFEELTNNYVTKEQVLTFQNELQCFRHGEEKLIVKRNQFNDSQKNFMVDYGLTILAVAKKYIDDNGLK